MDKQLKYSESDKMSEVICKNYNLLQVMSRFGLAFGFGDQTVKQACEQQGVDAGTFLAVVNFLDSDGCIPESYPEKISAEALVSYLRQAHVYFLDFCLPAIRRKLIEAIDCTQNEVAVLILKFFDEYVSEVRTHMEYENETVFHYVESLLKGEPEKDYNIGMFAARHNQIETKLTELKNIIVKYYPSNSSNHLLNSVLFDIYSCEKDLASHCRVEDYMFVPMMIGLENKLLNDGGQ